MKLSRPTPNTLMWTEQRSRFYLLVVGGVLLIFLWFNVGLAQTVGRWVITCDRAAAATDPVVTCQWQTLTYLGLVPETVVTHTHITAAAATVETISGTNYQRDLHRVVVEVNPVVAGSDRGVGQSPADVVTAERPVLVDHPPPLAGWDDEAAMMAEIAAGINQFMATNAPTWRYERWYDEVGFSLYMVVMLTGFIVFTAFRLRREATLTTYTLTRSPSLATGQVTFEFTRQSWRSHVTHRFSWKDIQALLVNRQVSGGKHRQVIYIPVIRQRQAPPLVLARGSTQLEAEALLQQVKAFLRGQSTVPLYAEPQSLAQPLFTGQKASYLTTHSTALPTSAMGRLRQRGDSLRQLGAVYLGDVRTTKTRGLTLYTYHVPALRSYAVLYDCGYHQGLEFYCTFADGSSLTTSSKFVLFWNWGTPRSDFCCHLGFNTEQLYQAHRQNQRSRQVRSGSVQPVRPTLVGVMQTIEEHLQTRKGLLITL